MIITLQTLIFFRESLLNALDRLLRPYYKKFSLTFRRNGEVSDDEEPEEHVYAEYNDKRGVVFYPPMYVQRYAAVSDCLMDERWCGKLEKVVDIGYHDMSFIKYLKEVPGIKCILGVDIETIPLSCSSDLIGCDDYIPKRETPLQVTLFKGNAADPDYRLIGCDAVVSIEMIEHMLPHDLDRLIHTVFGFIKPMIAIFTTPNADFNVLFKSLEKNGLRRLDHFFEWSREQFHDWCSNIVSRYPQYIVSCKGIGPGPPDTLHLGCCSQMALFINNEYSKQQDLNINSLALVSNTPSPHSISNLISSWESCDVIPNESKMIALERASGPITNLESCTELNSERRSSITLVLTSSSYSSDTLSFRDKMSQCNLDTEAGRNYLMFDYEQMCFDLVKPRRKLDSRVYVIEDVNSRLNCTTMQVKKFSKTTQNLMAKHKLDSLVHTREVVDEIRHLRKMLNFNRKCLNQLPDAGSTIWCNINWGENAPYWNQYYKVVREYNYPFESKSEECRILELISDEINRLIDVQFDDELSMDTNQLEIPIEHLMGVVEHISNDVDKVKDLLEWNGYEVAGDVVIHSRLVVDNASLPTQDQDNWQDTDTYSDWDSTDMRSTSLSDGSTVLQDYHARCLRRALDQKVRKLRSMLTADEDITTELDQVVCRLMKLALRTSKGRQTPPPTRWMQCKLLDLLTLTEKSIERRKRQFVESYPLKAINFDQSEDRVALEKIKEDDTALKIVDKYKHLVKQSDEARPKYRFLEDLEDNLSVSSVGFAKEYDEIHNIPSPSLFAPEFNLTTTTLIHAKELASKFETTLERTQAWVEDDIEIVPYPDHDANFDNSSGDIDQSVANFPKYIKKNCKERKNGLEIKCVICKKSHSKTFKHKYEKKRKEKCSKTKLIKKETRKKSTHNYLGKITCNKYVSVDNKCNRIKPPRKHYRIMYPTTFKPIPSSFIELSQPEQMTGNIIGPCNDNVCDIINDMELNNDNQQNSEVAATKESLLIGIVTDDVEEIVALRRTIGIDANVDPLSNEEETLIRSVSNTAVNDGKFLDKHRDGTENVHSQTIFLYDIDEPTTSKGIRHIGMDVQCGPDNVPVYPTLSATTSLSRMPKLFTAGINIGGSVTDANIKNTDCSTCTNEVQTTHNIQSRERSVGIKIKDSNSNIPKLKDDSSSTNPAYIKNADCETFTNNTNYNKVKRNAADIRIESIGSRSMTNIKIRNTDCYTYTHDIYDNPPGNLINVSDEKTIKGSNLNNLRQPDGSHSPTRTKIKTKNNDFEICTYDINDYETIITEAPVIGLKIKKSDSNVHNKMEHSTNTIGFRNISNDFQQSSQPETHNLIKCDPCKEKNNKVTSEIREASFVKPPLNLDNSLGSFKRLNRLLPKTKNIIVPGNLSTNHAKSRLCRGGIQVHSFRDKQTSEDVMYQGEWQKNKPKVLTRRKIFNSAIIKRISDTNMKKRSISKEKNPSMKINNIYLRREQKFPLPRDTETSNIKHEFNRNEIKISPKHAVTTGVAKAIKQPFRNVIKVPSKITMSSAPTKTPKSTFVVKKPSIISNLTTKDVQPQTQVTNKNYLPLYLRRRISKLANDSLNKIKTNLNSSLDSAKPNNGNEKHIKSLVRSKTVEINRDLLKFQAKGPIPNILVLRNEIENKSSDKQQIRDSPDNVKRRDSGKHRQVSPTSANSSTCSSPNSVATVRTLRPKNVTNRRCSISSYKMNNAKSESENTTPDRNKKAVKRSKSAKTPEKAFENKENIPQTSKQNNIGKKESDTFGKGTFMGQKKDVFRAHLKGSPPLQSNLLVKNKAQKSNIPKSDAFNQSPTVSKRLSFKSNVSSPTSNKCEDVKTSQTSDMVLVIEAETRKFESYAENMQFDTMNFVNNNWIDRDCEGPNSTTAMRQLLDEVLEFVDDQFDNTLIDSETVILNHEDNIQPIDVNPSTSFKTVITNDGNYILENDIEHALNRSFDTTLGDESVVSLNDTRMTVTDFDMLSFKSVTSTSRLSEYLSADNEFSTSQVRLVTAAPNTTSVCEIFERKDLAVYNQNFIDSETGSLAVNRVNRQATSEELFVSGRSSDSFESCLLDEDSVVPNWLFQIISQQQSAMDEVESPLQLMVPLPVAEPMYDDNGNVAEGPGAGAGAGDGRGMHSDNSQDSSAQGTSLSSSDTSSGMQSEGVLIDPSAFAAQFELLREAIDDSGVVLAINEPMESLANATAGRQGPVEAESHSLSRGESRRTPRARTPASDVDADVSSLDTDDLPDSSNY